MFLLLNFLLKCSFCSTTDITSAYCKHLPYSENTSRYDEKDKIFQRTISLMKFPRKTIFMLIRVRLWTTRGKLSIRFVSWVNQPTQLCFEISKLNTMKKVWPEYWRLCRKPTKLTSFLTFRQCTGRWIPIKLAVIISKNLSCRVRSHTDVFSDT